VAAGTKSAVVLFFAEEEDGAGRRGVNGARRHASEPGGSNTRHRCGCAAAIFGGRLLRGLARHQGVCSCRHFPVLYYAPALFLLPLLPSSSGCAARGRTQGRGGFAHLHLAPISPSCHCLRAGGCLRHLTPMTLAWLLLFRRRVIACWTGCTWHLPFCFEGWAVWEEACWPTFLQQRPERRTRDFSGIRNGSAACGPAFFSGALDACWRRFLLTLVSAGCSAVSHWHFPALRLQTRHACHWSYAARRLYTCY